MRHTQAPASISKNQLHDNTGLKLRHMFALPIDNNNRLLFYGLMTTEAKANDTMTCAKCNAECRRFGKHRNGLRRYRAVGDLHRSASA